MDEQGRVVGYSDRKPITEIEGVRYTHAAGFIDKFGNPANVDYLETKSGERYNNSGTKLSKNLRKANIGSFWVDENNKLYTEDKNPVIANNKHVGMDDEGNALIDNVKVKKFSEFDDKMKAAEVLESENSDTSLEAQLKAAGIGGQDKSANSVLDRLKAKKNQA